MEEKGASKNCPRCGYEKGSAPESALHLSPGMVLQEKFLIGKALGQGGFGITYLAWDFNLNLKLAIKEYLPQELAYRTGGQSDVSIYKQSLADNFNYGLEKFLEEARTLARFNEHPNIVSVRDFFKANGTGYLVMNYMEGVTLKQYMESRKEPLPFEQALNIFMPVLDALKEVHAAGILHRDISPDNLLIDAQGRVILIDFGAARQAMGEKSRSLSVIMKPGYSPLEQYQSKGRQGPWTDIYAVAATMYHAVTGVMPPESMDRIDEDNLTPPSQLGINIDPDKEQALLEAMAVRAKDRYQTAEEFQAKLLEGKPDVEKESPEADHPGKPQNVEEAVKKRCPYCSEKIKATAISCKYCKMDLQKGQQQAKEKPERPLPSDVNEGARPNEKAGSVKSEVKYSEDGDDQKLKVGGLASKTADRMPGIFKAAAIVFLCVFIIGAISFFGGNEETIDSSGNEETIDYSGNEETIDYSGNEETIDYSGNEETIDYSGNEETIDYRGGTYTGEVKYGKPHGQGTAYYPNGAQYVGEFKDGERNGQGTHILPSGSKYIGEWKDGVQHGQGTRYCKDGIIEYEGEWKYGEIHGQGTEYYWNGTKYVGEFKDGRRHGQGTRYYEDGTIEYEGEWKDGVKYGYGQGTKTWASGDKYVGEFKDGEIHGQGTYTWADGEKYVGEWKDGERTGQGTFYYASGDKYVGEFKDGERTGQGTYTWPSGDKYVGEFKDGRGHGQGTYYFASGNKYVGEFKDGRRHGQGTFYYASGNVESGRWEHGEYVGR